MRSYKVISCAKDDTGNLIGVRNSNQILDTNVYNVMLPYVPLQQYDAKFIAENMYSQVDAEGYQYKLMDEIIDHRNNVHAFHSD